LGPVYDLSGLEKKYLKKVDWGGFSGILLFMILNKSLRLNKKIKSNFLEKFETHIIIIIISTAVVTAMMVLVLMTVHNKHILLRSLQDRSKIIISYVKLITKEESFYEFNAPGDIDRPLFRDIQAGLSIIRELSSLKYLYTVKRNDQGKLIYVIDSLDIDTTNFLVPGSPVEKELWPQVEQALSGEIVLAKGIQQTAYGPVYISFWPVFTGEDVIGVIGMEYDASEFYDRNRTALVYSIGLIVFFIILFCLSSSILFKGIARPFQKKLAYLDILTGLNNRTAFELDKKRLESNLKSNLPVSMIMFDLNNLKHVNDTLGHDKGDTYINLAARLIHKHFNDFGSCYRIGGDEFCVIMVRTDPKPLETILEENFAPEVLALKNTIVSEGEGYFSIAYGMAAYTSETSGDLHELFILADKRMYTKKKQMKEPIDEVS
jgi:diguanylate cyclase (GGDEF)-like protein